MTKKKLLRHGEAMYAALRGIMQEHGRGRATGAYKVARELITRMHVRHPEKQAVRAFFVEVYGLPKTYIPARCSEQAKMAVVRQTDRADRKDMLSLVKVGRVKAYDTWALTAEQRLHVIDEMPQGLGNLR